MTKIEQAKKKAIAGYKKRQGGKPETVFEKVLWDVGVQTFTDGWEAAVKAMKGAKP